MLIYGWKMKKIISLIVVLLLSQNLYSIEKLLFKPLTANTFEPRMGSVFSLDHDDLRLDIGGSIDLSTLHKSDSSEIRLGGDFFTYTRLRSEGKFKFPVETSDYFFGVNVSGKTYLFDNKFDWRVRLSHISSHLVDGYSRNDVFYKSPFVYSREFIEAIGATYYKDVRFYAGFAYIFSTLPKNVSKFNPQFGFDGEHKFYKNLYASYGCDFNISAVKEESKLNSSAQVGVIFKSTMKTGIGFYYYLYNGWNIHGMFYDEKISNSGVGFQLIF